MSVQTPIPESRLSVALNPSFDAAAESKATAMPKFQSWAHCKKKIASRVGREVIGPGPGHSPIEHATMDLPYN